MKVLLYECLKGIKSGKLRRAVCFPMQRNYWFIALGIVWAITFSGMSFYWARGGLLGVRSLGGAIYNMSQNPSPSFLMIVWLTGFIKLIGLILLLMLLVQWKKLIITSILYYVAKFTGALLFLYGFLNFFTITLSTFHVLDFNLGSYATFWRLIFWEPF
ncbi:DUF3995 domain-containing protein [Virgibacillus sp. 179-BFC.A HS]|uniref:DUF3995 domain-containing protein n=1 Tax=Tigheibacillus jepli TaxID=3035914 RepID=A0ABU5CLQ6_9BACI|nr:DUF3995 domain-containing protein [Virgibacillus sp. 179-BFC.A HS]MDY0406826.1 DUF3995 domain-containing protein [Virgibacillus sp. 179-BFC.A HS]